MSANEMGRVKGRRASARLRHCLQGKREEIFRLWSIMQQAAGKERWDVDGVIFATMRASTAASEREGEGKKECDRVKKSGSMRKGGAAVWQNKACILQLQVSGLEHRGIQFCSYDVCHVVCCLYKCVLSFDRSKKSWFGLFGRRESCEQGGLVLLPLQRNMHSSGRHHPP